jgi:flagellar hook-length control protein FliK
MTNGLTSPRAADRPPGPAPQAARGAPPPSDAFAGMLDAHQARTATAEGQHSESPDKGASKPSAPDAGPSADAKPADNGDQKQPSAGDTAPLAALVLAAVPVAATTTPQPGAPVEGTPAPATQMVVAGGAPTPVVQLVTPADAAAVTPAVQAEVAATGPVVATPAAAAAVAATAPVAVDPAPSTPVAQPATPQPVAAAPAAPAQTATPDGNFQGQPKPDTGTPAPVVQQAPPAAEQARPGQQPQGQPQAQPAQVQPPVQQQQQHTAAAPPVAMTSAAPASPATPLPAATPVPLARTAETVEHVLSLASARGITHARIALHPAELGTVDVHIRSTAEGLVARVVAHSAEAVQTLQHAAGDLRRSLEEQGLNVLNLDINQSGESGTGRAGADSGGRKTFEGASAGTAETDDPTTASTTLRLPSGVLVDVLA